jgi:hypothetical protein
MYKVAESTSTVDHDARSQHLDHRRRLRIEVDLRRVHARQKEHRRSTYRRHQDEAVHLKYILRPPVATEHVTFTPDGLVRIALKRPFRDGTVASTWILCRFCVAWPPPCPPPGSTPFAMREFWRPRPRGAPWSSRRWSKMRSRTSPNPHPTPLPHPGHRCRYRPWAELLRRTFSCWTCLCATPAAALSASWQCCPKEKQPGRSSTTSAFP